MEIDRAFVLYFSGTGTTARYARAFAGALPCGTQTVDLGAKETLGGLLLPDQAVVDSQ